MRDCSMVARRLSAVGSAGAGVTGLVSWPQAAWTLQRLRVQSSRMRVIMVVVGID
jgi:hypothetical protein